MVWYVNVFLVAIKGNVDYTITKSESNVFVASFVQAVPGFALIKEKKKTLIATPMNSSKTQQGIQGMFVDVANQLIPIVGKRRHHE